MKIGQFTKEYTDGKGVYIKDVFSEVEEFLVEVVKFNLNGMKEEFADVVVFVQLWMYDKYKINGDLWRMGKSSYKKFMDRRDVWKQIYNHVGLENPCNFCGNYNKKHKVVNHLKEFGVSEDLALAAYTEIVLK